MCGFAGFVNNNSRIDAQRVIELMGDRIQHRGPDDAQYYVDADIALAFRRLSIIDLEGGRQPLFNEDESMVLVFNGEIYNFEELREDLLARGHVFTTRSDSETILHGYEEYGAGILDKLRGMFAFAIWDKRTKKLFGARDIFGIKPYYYYQNGDCFLFGSEIKSFLDHPDFEKSIVRERIPEYLSYEYLADDATLFEGVRKLMPGSYFEWTADSFITNRYYNPTYCIDEEPTLEEWADRIEEVFTESVQAHQIADVEVGGFLSSGVDSSYVVDRVYSQGTSIRTFSVGYEEERYSELSYAKSFSDELGVQNISNKISAADFFDAMPDIQYYMDEPLPNPSENPLYFLAQNAARHVKVVLSGEGADELFGGYPNYLAEDHIGHYCKRVPRGLRRTLGAVASKLPAVKGRHFLMAGGMEPWERFSRANYVFENEDRARFLKDPITGPTPQERSREYFAHVQGLDAVSQLQYVDMQTWMAFDILLKADRMSMAHSLELRVPFLDKRVLELAMQIPARYRAAHDESKIALRHAAARHLPERVYRKEKLGFPSPLAEWLREDEYYERVKAAFVSEAAEEFFHTNELVRLLDEHRSGAVSHMQKIWSFYTFIVWYEEFFGAGERAACRA